MGDIISKFEGVHFREGCLPWALRRNNTYIVLLSMLLDVQYSWGDTISAIYHQPKLKPYRVFYLYNYYCFYLTVNVVSLYKIQWIDRNTFTSNIWSPILMPPCSAAILSGSIWDMNIPEAFPPIMPIPRLDDVEGLIRATWRTSSPVSSGCAASLFEKQRPILQW